MLTGFPSARRVGPGMWNSLLAGTIFLAILGLCTSSPSSQTQPRPSNTGVQAAAKPSLDGLVQRVNAYWSLLARGKKLEAANFVERSCRDVFVKRTVPAFSRPRITKLELTTSGKEVSVTVNVLRNLPPLPGELDWPVVNQWVFSGGAWYVVAKNDGVLPLYASTPQAKGTALSPEEIEKRQTAIRGKLAFTRSEIDFGTVRQGNQANFDFEYDLTGDQILGVTVKHSRITDDLLGPADQKLHPGKAQRVAMSLLTDSYDGPIDERITLLVHDSGVQVPYEFRLSGRVYTPLTAIPRVVRLKKGELEKRVEIRNNSASEVTLESIYSESVHFEVGPLPQVLVPGGTCELTVKSRLKDSPVNRAETVMLHLARPVDEMYNLPLPIVTNSQEPKREGLGPLSPKQLQEYIQKSQQQSVRP